MTSRDDAGDVGREEGAGEGGAEEDGMTPWKWNGGYAVRGRWEGL